MSMMMTELDVQSKCAVTSNIVFWSASILCFLLDRFILSPKTLQEQKVQGNKAFLSESEMWDIFKLAFLNMGPVTILFVKMEHVLRGALDIPQMSEQEPWNAVREIPLFVACIVTMMLWFYFTHRLLHVPYLYKTVHKVHHRFKAPCAMAAVYAHPIEFIFGNVAGVGLGPMLTNCHPYTAYAWFSLALLATCKNHSGYKCLGAQQHDAHHEFFNYNFGNDFLDDFFGTKLPKDKEH